MLQLAVNRQRAVVAPLGCSVTCADEAVQPQWLPLNLFHMGYLTSRFVKGHELILSLLLKVFLRLKLTN